MVCAWQGFQHSESDGTRFAFPLIVSIGQMSGKNSVQAMVRRTMDTPWEELPSNLYESLWTPVDKRFAFRPSTTEFPGSQEPIDSATYSIGHVYGEAERYSRLTLDLSRTLASALRDSTKPTGFVNVLDWQHSSYRFWPHAPFEYQSEEDWPVPILPNGDYYLFLDPDLEFGILGHPWEQTICLFGSEFLNAVSRNLPELFDKPIRLGGKVV